MMDCDEDLRELFDADRDALPEEPFVGRARASVVRARRRTRLFRWSAGLACILLFALVSPLLIEWSHAASSLLGAAFEQARSVPGAQVAMGLVALLLAYRFRQRLL